VTDILSKKRILVVCVANYCRSPVAMHLLRKYFSNEHEIDSAGLIQYEKMGMDPRSLEFLKDFFTDMPLHQPKIITNQLIDRADLVFAIDLKVMMQLNKLYKQHIRKIKLFSIAGERTNINDPINYNKEDYQEIMKKIDYVSSKILI